MMSASGKITYLRVNDVGTGYGPGSDYIDVETVIGLDTMANAGFGFRLRNDTNAFAHQGMLDLLRDAFDHNWTANIDYNIPAGKKNGVIMRVWLSK